jgi:hypothetical protein
LEQQLSGGERVTWSFGNHSIKVGGDARKFNWDMLGFFQKPRVLSVHIATHEPDVRSPTAPANAFASFLLGLPALAQRQAGTPSMKMRQWAYDGFVQDDWRLGSSLTINVGLRYEVQTPLHDISKDPDEPRFQQRPACRVRRRAARLPEGVGLHGQEQLRAALRRGLGTARARAACRFPESFTRTRT